MFVRRTLWAATALAIALVFTSVAAASRGPSTPTNLRITATGPTSISLAWDPSRHSGSNNWWYCVQRNGAGCIRVNPPNTTLTLAHTFAAAAGLSALIVSSAVAFSVVKYAGAAYLVYLGIRRLLEREPPADVAPRGGSLARLFWRGALVNVLNPKTALFLFAFLPQFVDPDRAVWSQVVFFGLLFVALGLLSDGLYAVTAGTLGRWLRRRPGILRWRSGSVYVGLGALTAVTKRT